MKFAKYGKYEPWADESSTPPIGVSLEGQIMTFALASGSFSTSNVRLFMLHFEWRNHYGFRADDLRTTCRPSSGLGHLLRICTYWFVAMRYYEASFNFFNWSLANRLWPTCSFHSPNHACVNFDYSVWPWRTWDRWVPVMAELHVFLFYITLVTLFLCHPTLISCM